MRQGRSETAEVNITCNQQMTTQKMEGAGIERDRVGVEEWGRRQGELT